MTFRPLRLLFAPFAALRKVLSAFFARTGAAAGVAGDRVSAFAEESVRAWISRVRAPLFRPDVVVAPDPLAPDPAVVARGLAAAMARCAAEGAEVRVLAGRAPGARFSVSFDAVKRTCSVELERPRPRRGVPSAATEPLPPFTQGLEPSVLVLDGDGDDLRLLVSPGTGRDSRLRVRRV